MTTTIDHIAQKVGVSPMTVSRALRDSPLVAQKTKQRVLEAADELGYTPNLLARSLAQQKSPFISLIVTELSNPFFAPIITAIQEIVREQNYYVMIGDSESRMKNQEALLKHFQQIQIGGLIITPLTSDRSALQSFRDSGTPVVVTARRWENGDYVSADNITGGKLVAEHLLELGHRNIGCLSLRETEHTAIVDRVYGFREHLQEAGINLSDQQTLLAESLRIENGIRAAEEFVKLSPRPTAIFVVADRLAVGFIDQLIKLGIRVPDDVSVVGYDDIRYSAYLKVPLTTVALPKFDIGRIAAEILFDRIQFSKPTCEWQQVLLKPELVVRASTLQPSPGSAVEHVQEMNRMENI